MLRLKLNSLILPIMVGSCAPSDEARQRRSNSQEDISSVRETSAAPWWDKTIARDLTGDGRPESLRLMAYGQRPESLRVTLSISSVDHAVLYTISWPSAGYFAHEGPIDSISHSRLAAQVREELSGFFSDDAFGTVGVVDSGDAVETIGHQVCVKFSNDAFIADSACPDTLARPLWKEMRRLRTVTFSFGSGGEVSRTIAWSVPMRRFLEVFACC